VISEEGLRPSELAKEAVEAAAFDSRQSKLESTRVGIAQMLQPQVREGGSRFEVSTLAISLRSGDPRRSFDSGSSGRIWSAARRTQLSGLRLRTVRVTNAYRLVLVRDRPERSIGQIAHLPSDRMFPSASPQTSDFSAAHFVVALDL
jgi:hypothetical protein